MFYTVAMNPGITELASIAPHYPAMEFYLPRFYRRNSCTAALLKQHTLPLAVLFIKDTGVCKGILTHGYRVDQYGTVFSFALRETKTKRTLELFDPHKEK